MDAFNANISDTAENTNLSRLSQNAFIQGKYGECLDIMCHLFSQGSATVKEQLKPYFVIALGRYTKCLESSGSWEDLFSCFEKALAAYPECEEVHHTLGALLFRLGFVDKAALYFRQAALLNPDFTAARESLESVKNALLDRWHFSMINDYHRNMAFYRAIENAVNRKHTAVLDIGTGTGILSMFAAKCGARQIIACEASEVLCEVAKDVLQANGMRSQVQLINKMSTELCIPEDIPERVSLVVTETFDAGLFGEHVLTSLIHAIKELMLPPPCSGERRGESLVTEDERVHRSPRKRRARCSSVGQVIPGSAVVWAGLIECRHVRNKSRLQERVLGNIGLGAVQDDDDPYTTEKLASVKGGFRFLSKPWKLLSVNFGNLKELEMLQDGITKKFSVDCSDSGCLDAVAVWFDLHLDQDNTLSTSPSSTTCWEQAIFPVLPHHLGDKTVHVSTKTSVVLKVTCKGHLTVQCLSAKNAIRQESYCPDTRIINLGSKLIEELNNKVMNDAYCLSLGQVFDQCCHPSVAVLNDFPWLGALALQQGAQRCATLRQFDKTKLSTLAQVCTIPVEKLVVSSVEDLAEADDEDAGWDVLIFDPVETSGVLKRQILEDVALLRASSMKDPFWSIPAKLALFCQLIESDKLVELAQAVGDDRTLNFKIAQFINVFQAKTYEDITLSTLPHAEISDKVCVLEVDFLHDAPSRLVDLATSVRMKVKQSGRVMAAVYWFHIHVCSGLVLDTSDSELHWNQAAIILPAPVNVVEDEELHLVCSCRKSVVDIEVIKVV